MPIQNKINKRTEPDRIGPVDKVITSGPTRPGSEILFHHQHEIRDKHDGHNVHQPFNVAALAGQEFDDRVGDQPSAKPSAMENVMGMPMIIRNDGMLSA